MQVKQAQNKEHNNDQIKKRYPLRDHYRYTFRLLREKRGAAALTVCGGDVALSEGRARAARWRPVW